MITRVLIVEDNFDQAMSLKKILELRPEHQYACEMVSTLKAALDRIVISNDAPIDSDLVVDGILLDLTLPDARDMEAVKAVSAVSKTIGIVVLTGWGDKGLELTAKEAGADALLVKGKAEPRDVVLQLQFAIWQKRDEKQRHALEDTLGQIGKMVKSLNGVTCL